MPVPSNLHVALKSEKILFLFLILFSAMLISCKDTDYAKVSAAPGEIELQKSDGFDTQKDLVSRGEYLVTSIGCADCHSPKRLGERGPEEDPVLKLSGYRQGQELPPFDPKVVENGWILMNMELTAAAGPWGVSFAANLTSDETGIGNWSFEQFKTAMRKGKFKGMENGRDLLPPMPWPNFAHLTDDDLQAMFAYLKSTEPVQNAVPAPIPPDKMGSLQKK